MVSEITRRGLIVAPARRGSDLLEELVSHFNWPVLLQPSVRLLLQQIEVHAPHCLLFWLDETHDIGYAIQLISRLRDRGPRPYRIAVAHQLGPDAEPRISSAGVHSFLFTSGSVAPLVQNALLALLDVQPQAAPADPAFQHAEPLVRGSRAARASPLEMRPP